MNDEFDNSLSINQVAKILAVHRNTVYKWLAHDDTHGAAIPRSGWYRLPGGQIRIRRSAVKKLQSEG